MKLFRIKDSFVVLSDKDIPADKKKALQEMTFDYFCNNSGAWSYSDWVDRDKSVTLGLELPRDRYLSKPEQYKNYLKDDSVQQDIVRENRKYSFVYANFKVDDEEIPQGIKNAGVVLENDCLLYKLKYDDNQKKYIFFDRTGQECDVSTDLNYAKVDGVRLTMRLEMFGFEKEDEARLRVLLNKKEYQLAADFEKSLSPRDKALLDINIFVRDKVKKAEKQMPYTLVHYLTHIRNKIFANRFDVAAERGKLSVRNCFRLMQYDEKSAHLKENLKAIENYVQQPNLDDFSMFPEKSQWLVSMLNKVPADKRKALVSNRKIVAVGTFINWDSFYEKDFDKRFKKIAEDWAYETPISFVAQNTENDEAEYQKRRSAILTFDVKNSQTGRKEKVDFSQYIEKDIEIKAEIEQGILQDIKLILAKRSERLKVLGLSKIVIAKAQIDYRRANQKLGQEGKEKQVLIKKTRLETRYLNG